MITKSICFIGNPYLMHSYSLVMNNHIIDLINRGTVDVCIKCTKPYNPDWIQDKEFKQYSEAHREILKNVKIVGEESIDGYTTISYTYPATKADYIFYTQESTNQGFLRDIDLSIVDQLHFITPSQFSKDNQDSVFPIPTTVIHHGIDQSIYYPSSTHSDDYTNYILMAGAMTTNKGIYEAMLFISKLRKIDDSFKLILKTSSFLYESQMCIDGAVHYLFDSGYLSEEDVDDLTSNGVVIIDQLYTHEEMANLYRQCKYYISLYKGEGFNLPALEAHACGCTVIVPSQGPTTEFIENNVINVHSVFDHEKDRVISCDVMDAVHKVLDHSFVECVSFTKTNKTWSEANDKLLELINA